MKISIELDGVTQTHIAGVASDYATVCGQALDGDEFSGTEVKTQAKITCPTCFAIWKFCQNVKFSDFKVEE